jgi:hypothetical protein
LFLYDVIVTFVVARFLVAIRYINLPSAGATLDFWVFQAHEGPAAHTYETHIYWFIFTTPSPHLGKEAFRRLIILSFC